MIHVSLCFATGVLLEVLQAALILAWAWYVWGMVELDEAASL